MTWPAVACLLAACLLAAGLSWSGVALIRAAALRWSVLDVPNERSSHRDPVPLCGGVALVAVNAALWASLIFIRPGLPGRHALALLAGGLLIALVSLLDDLRALPCQIRLVVQGMAAIIFMAGATHWRALSLPLAGLIPLGSAGIIVTGLWIIFLTNAYNFMDGIDGMVGGQALAAGSGWVMLGLLTGHLWLVMVGGVLAASSGGFLLHNWHPARIFLGDVGSTFLGYSLAAIAVMAGDDEPSLGLAGVLLVWPAVFDTGFTLACRLRRRQSIVAGHRGFLFHRLTDAGWSQERAAFLYIALAVLGTLLAYLLARGPAALHGAPVLAIPAACFGLWYLVRRQERRQVGASPVPRALAARWIGTGGAATRRLTASGRATASPTRRTGRTAAKG